MNISINVKAITITYPTKFGNVPLSELYHALFLEQLDGLFRNIKTQRPVIKIPMLFNPNQTQCSNVIIFAICLKF